MQRLARTITRLLDLERQHELALDLETPELQTALESLLGSAGASIVAELATSGGNGRSCPQAAVDPEGHREMAEGSPGGLTGRDRYDDVAMGSHPLGSAGPMATSGVIEIGSPPSPLLPARARELVKRVVPGGVVVVVIHHVAGSAATLAQQLGPVFDLDHVHGEAGPEGEHPIMVLRGLRRPQPDRARIKELRGLAHGLEASVLIGRDGLSAGLVASAREALERHGLIKAKLTPRARLDKEDSAVELASAAGGQLVQRIGKTAVLFRPDVPLQPPTMKGPLAGPISTLPAKKPAPPARPRVPSRRPIKRKVAGARRPG